VELAFPFFLPFFLFRLSERSGDGKMDTVIAILYSSGFARSSQRPTNNAMTRFGQMQNTYWAAMTGKDIFRSDGNEVTMWSDEGRYLRNAGIRARA
jgi:hypothetical protein